MKNGTKDKPDWERLPRERLKQLTEKWHSTSGFGEQDMEALVGIRPGKKEAQAKLEEIGRLRTSFLLNLGAWSK